MSRRQRGTGRIFLPKGSSVYRLDFKEERKLWDAIERVYVLEPGQRTISSFVNIIGELKERLHRWTAGGQYGFVFDNPEDALSFSRFQTFNFAGWAMPRRSWSRYCSMSFTGRRTRSPILRN